MRQVKLLFLGLAVASCASCLTAATASAVPGWLINGNILGANETATASFTSTKTAFFRWQNGSDKFKIECKKQSSTEKLKGGLPGTSNIESFTFEECFYTAPTGCVLTTPTATNLPWSSTLETVSGWISNTIYQVYTMHASTTASSCANGAYNKPWPITGNERAQMSDLVADVRVKFPEEILSGDTLETEKDPVEFSTEGELKLPGAEEKLRVAEVENPEISPAPTTSSPLTFTTSSTGKAVLETALAKIECAKENSASGEFTGVREGTATLTFHGCKLSSNGCKSSGAAAETISMGVSIQLVDLEKEAKLVLGMGFTPTTTEAIVECGTTKVKIKNAAIGEVKEVESGKKTKTATWLFKQEKGKQALKECHLIKALCEGKKYHLEVNAGLGFEEAGLETEQKITFGKEVSISF